MNPLNILWYEDDELAIFFNHKPNTHMLEPLPNMTQADKDLIEIYPFINCTPLKVALFDKKLSRTFKFTIPKSYRWDGASIHKIFWWIIGSKTNPKFRTPSMIHDFICCNKYTVDFDCNYTSRVFRALLAVAGVPKWKRNIMYFCVDLWQGWFCDWGID